MYRHLLVPIDDSMLSVEAEEEFRHLFARILNLAPEALVGGSPGSAS